MIQSNDEGEFVETDCTIKLGDREFSANGAYIERDTQTGKLRGLLYLQGEGRHIGTWDGSKKVPCTIANTWTGSFGDTRCHYAFIWDDKPFSGIRYGNSDIVHVREVSPVCRTQGDAARLWADWMTDTDKDPDKCPQYRAGSIRAEGRELMHYSTVQEWRTRDGLLIGNEDCWSAGFSHCTTSRSSGWLSLKALKAEGIDHLSMESAGCDEEGLDAYRASRHGRPAIFRETVYVEDTEFDSGRSLKWLQIREGDEWISIRGIRETGRDHLSMPVEEARAWLKEKGKHRTAYFKGLANRCREVIPTRKNFDWLGVELYGVTASNSEFPRDGQFDFRRRSLNGRPALYYRTEGDLNNQVRIVETYTTVHNPRAFVWKIVNVNSQGLPVGVGLLGKDETGQVWFYEFPLRFRHPRYARWEQPFGVSAVHTRIVDLERALLGMSKEDVLVAEA